MNNLKELPIEDLLELAKNTVEEKSKFKINKHVAEFIKDYGILPGLTLVPTHVIYYNYKRVWRSESRTKISKIAFFRNFNKLFEQKRKTKVRYYLLNEESFDLTTEELYKTKLADKIYENRRKKENLEKLDKTS